MIPYSILFAIVAAVSPRLPSTLDQALQTARVHRPALEAARLRVLQAERLYRSSGAFPATTLSVGYSSDLEIGGSDEDLVLAQPIDLFGRGAAARRSAEAGLALAHADQRRVAVQVQSEVIQAYIGAAAAEELVQSAVGAEETLTQLYEATRRRVEGGVAPGVQLTRVSLDLERARLTAQRRRAEAEGANARLRSTLGGGEIGAPRLPESLISRDPARNLSLQRPDLLLLAAEAQAAQAEANRINVSARPTFEVQARKTPWQAADDRFGVRIQLSMPVFDSGVNRAETKAADTRAEAAKRALDDAARLAEGEVLAAEAEMRGARSQVERYAALVVEARELVARLRPGLTQQATTLIEVLDATRALREIEQAHVEARERRARAEAEFLRATGALLEVSK